MAKITEVVSSVTVKVNLGDYQSVDFFTSIKAEVEDGELIAVANGKVHMIAVAATLAKLRGHFAARGKKYTDDTLARMYGLRIPPTAQKDFP